MAAKDNDDLARMLSGMADGEYSEETPREEGESVEMTPPPAPAAPAPASPQVRPAAKAPAPKPAAPKPLTAMPVVKKRPKPIPTAMPVAPEQEVVPDQEVVAEPELVVQEQVENVEESVMEEGVGDDAVMVPAPAPEMLAHTHRPRPVRAQRQHLVQSMAFKQAIIPIAWSAGLICLMYVMVGLLSGENSPLRAFRVPWLAVSFGFVGLVMIGVGVVTMMQVRNQR